MNQANPSSSVRKRVALVGHCGADSYSLERAVRDALGDADVLRVNDEGDLRAELDRADLLLVNRVLDGRFGTGSGVELIRVLAAHEGRRPALMLVSNYEDAQAEAEAAGAVPGVGKSRLDSREARERIASGAGAMKA